MTGQSGRSHSGKSREKARALMKHSSRKSLGESAGGGTIGISYGNRIKVTGIMEKGTGMIVRHM